MWNSAVGNVPGLIRGFEFPEATHSNTNMKAENITYRGDKFVFLYGLTV